MMDSRLISLLEEYNPTDTSLVESIRLYHDLNIHGDEAIELLNRFRDQFEIDISKFHFNDYFPSEGDWVLPNLFRWLMGRKPKEYKPITLSDLHRAIHIGYLE